MAFDPNQPFDVISGGGSSGFDPSKPFEIVEEPKGDSLEQFAAGLEAGVGRVGRAFAGGAVGGVRAFSDVLGANNPISKKLAGVEDYLDSLMSAQSRNNQEEIGRIFDEAESKGLKDKVVAGLEAFTIAPEETLAQAGGYMLPNIAAGVLGKAAQLGKLGITAVQVGTGAAQAAGTVKGEIYRGVTDYLREKGLPEDQIEPIATKAQAWGGKNMDQIILAAGLGGLAASTGAERIITRMLTKTGKEVSKKSIGEILKGGIKGGAAEAVTEFPQEAQEQVAQNLALQRIGAEVPTFKGAVQAGAMGAAAGLVLGGGAGAVEVLTAEEKAEQDINRDAEKEARNLSIPAGDTNAKTVVNEINRTENDINALREVYDEMDPATPEAQNLSKDIANAQKRLAGLKQQIGEPLAQAEAKQAELATAIAEEPVSSTITEAPVVSEERAQVSEITPAPETATEPTIREEPQVSPMIGAEPTQPAPAEVVAEPPRVVAPAPEPAAAPAVIPEREGAPTPEGIAVGNRIKLGRSPQTYEVVEVLPQSEAEIANDEQSFLIRNEKTSEVTTSERKGMKLVSGKGARRVAAQTQEITPRTTEEQAAFDKASSNKVMARNPQLAVAAVRMKNKEITVDEYADLVGALDPFVAKGPDPIPTKEKIQQYIAADKAGQVMQPIESGKEVEFRIDIPTYNRSTAAGDTVYAVTAHEPVAAEAKGVGKVISFVGVAKVNNPTFMTRSVSGRGAAIDIATGAGKFPLATVKGNYEPITELPADINDPNVWTEVGYNPIRSSQFIDVRSKNAVVGGDEALMVGSRVFVKNPKMEARPSGLIGPEGRYMTAEKVAPVAETDRYSFEDAVIEANKLFGGEIPPNFAIVTDPTNREFEFKAAYDPNDGMVILNLAYIRKGDNLQDIISHELGHYLYGDPEFQSAFEEFWNAMTPEQQALGDEIIRSSYNKNTGQIQVEEKQVRAFMSLIEEANAQPQWRKVLDAIKRWFNRVFGTEFQTTDRGALDVLAAGVKRFGSGEQIIRAEVAEAPRKMAAEPRREQQAGIKDIGKVIDTPAGINRRTEAVIRRDVFNSDEVNPEQTAKAYDLIDRLSRDPKEANNYADEINELTRKELSAEEKREVAQTIGAVKLGNELFKYAVNLAAKGDIRMLQLLTERFNDLATGAGGIGQDARNLQARQNLASWVKRAAESQKTGIVNAVAIQIYGPSATQEQIDLIRDAVNAVNKTRVEDADAIYTDLEETGSRTGVEIRKAVERAMDKADASSKDPWVMALEIVKAIEGFQKFTYEGLTISVPQNIKNLVSKNLANYRKKMKAKGADGLEKTFWKTMSDQENKMGPLGEVDAAVGRNLAAIVKDTLIKLGLKGEPPDTKMTLIEQVANILSNNELSTDRMAEADKRISEEIAARRGQEIADAEEANAGPETIDAIEAKWEGIQQAWDESMSRQMDIPISDATLRRLISNELKEDKTSISQFIKEVGDDLAISNARKGTIINKIISKLNGLNEDGSIKRDYTKLEEFLSSQFDQMVANQKLKNRMRSAVKKVAKEADPNKQADRQIERLAELQSDVQRWSQKREDKVRDIVAEDLRQRLDLGLKVADKIRRNWKPVLVQRLVDAGVNQDTAGILADIVWRQHEINYLNRKMAQVERAVTKGSLAPIIDAIKNTPLAQQQDPAWKRKVAYDYLINAGLDAQTAGRLADLMDATLQKVLAAAQAKAFEDTLKGKLGDQRSRRGMEKFLRAIRTGAIDPTKNLTSEIAAANGWTGFTSEQYARLSELDSIVNDNSKTEIELATAYKEIQDILADAKLQPKVREALAAYYTANALSGIPTATVNIFSPIGFALRNLMTDTMKNLATNPAALPATFDTFVSSWKTYFSEVAFSFKNNVQRRGVVEYLSNDDVLLRLYNKGKKQWQQGNRREGIKNMVVGMMEYVGRLLKALDEGAVSVLEQQGLTRYAMDAMQQAGISAKDARAAANAVLSKKQAFIEEMVAKGMNKTQAKAMSDDVFRTAWLEALTNFKIPSQQVLDAALNDALASVGRINNTMDGLKQENRNIRDLGFASAPPIGLLERLGESLNSDQATETQRVFYRMVYGFAIVPARVFREAAWFSPYGFVRFAVNYYSKKGGGKGRYAQSLGTDAQFRQRLTETIAGTIVLGSLLALSKGSDEDPFDELPFKIVVTGNGPERRLDPQFHADWNGKYKRNAIHFFFGKTMIPINIERGFEAFAIPFMLAGAYDDMKIRKRFEASKATPKDLTDASILAGAAFTAFNRRGPYSAFMDGLIRTQSADDTIPQLAKQALFLGKTFIPGVGTSLARNLSDFISDPVDTKSMEGALWSNVPVIGPMIGTKSMNAFGETTGPRDLSARMYRGGLPIVFDLPNNSQTEKLRDLVISKGQGPDIPTRYDVRRRLGYEPTNEQFEAYVSAYGKYMANTMAANFTRLKGQEPKTYVNTLSTYQQTAALRGEEAAKKIGNPDQP